jgi:hypothetical protein
MLTILLSLGGLFLIIWVIGGAVQAWREHPSKRR